MFHSAPSLEILGHTISATGAAPMADHAAEINNCKLLPPLVAQLRSSFETFE
jgi:hypothetical protein